MPADLLAAPGVPARLTALAGPLTGRPVRGVRLVEDPTSLSALPDGSLAILTGPASEHATGYRLDVALRDLTAAGGSALVLTSRTVPPVPLTARLIAERGGLALLHAAADPSVPSVPSVPPVSLDLAALVGAFTRVIGRDAEDALVRLSAAIDALLNASDNTYGTDSPQGLGVANGGGGARGPGGAGGAYGPAGAGGAYASAGPGGAHGIGGAHDASSAQGAGGASGTHGAGDADSAGGVHGGADGSAGAYAASGTNDSESAQGTSGAENAYGAYGTDSAGGAYGSSTQGTYGVSGTKGTYGPGGGAGGASGEGNASAPYGRSGTSDATGSTGAAGVHGVQGVDGEARRVLAAVTAALGVPLRAGRAGPGEIGAVAHGHGGEVAVAAPRSGGHLDRAVALAVRLAARAIARADDTGDNPVRSRSLLLSELLIAPEGQALRLLSRARALGLPVDGWHIVLRVEPAALQGADRYDLLDAADRAALRVLRSTGGHWNSARADDALLLIRSQPGDPGLRAAVETTERLLAGLRDRFPGADLRCGVGGAHQGPLGLRTSAREARTALARGGPRGGRPVTVHDLAGLDRMLGEWYASEAARASAEELLAPITGLGPDRARPLLRTLQAYLDHQGSPARAAEELHLHRNAVSDRIRRASTLLAVDLNDPEQRLALQLACRALHH